MKKTKANLLKDRDAKPQGLRNFANRIYASRLLLTLH